MVTSRLQSEYGKVKWLTDERVFIVRRQAIALYSKMQWVLARTTGTALE